MDSSWCLLIAMFCCSSFSSMVQEKSKRREIIFYSRKEKGMCKKSCYIRLH